MKLRVLLYCLLGGLPMLIAAMGAGHPVWCWLSGAVLAAAFVPVALFGPRGPLAQFGVIVPLLMSITVFCTATEAYFFVPSYRPYAVRNLVGAGVMYLIMAVALTLLASVFKLNRQSGPAVYHRSIAATLPLIPLAGLSYVVYYLIFGGITYQFFTKVYYPQAAQQAAQIGLWFWAMQLGRGTLMTLGALPVIYTLRMGRRQSAIAVGLLIWVAGGLSPLLLPNPMMVTNQRLIHIVEIFAQNAPLGLTAVLLLRRGGKPKAETSPQTAAASL